MKKSVFALLVLLALVSTTLAFAQENSSPFQTKTFQLNGTGTLITQTSGGSIRVTGGSGNQVKVIMYVRPANGFNPKEVPSPEALERYTFDVRQEGNTIYAVAARKDKSWDSKTALSVSFEIEVPRRMACRLKTSGGSITLVDLQGEQEAHTSGGSLTFNHINGNTKARTSGGGITLQDYTGQLDAATSGGSINLTKASGTLRVSTSGGSINLNQVSGNIAARTSGGSIRADVQQLGKYLTLATSGGSVTATIPGGKGLDLDLSGSRVRTTVNNFTGSAKENRVKGSMNGGGIQVKMSTSAGTTTLNYRM